jgi:hypothetical protein
MSGQGGSRVRVYFLCQNVCNYLQRLFRGGGAALRAVSTYFQTRNDNVKAAITLDLAFETVEKVTLKLHDLAAAQARHVNMIALRTPLVKMLLTLHVHQIKFVDQPVALQEVERAVNRHAVNSGIQSLGMAEDLRRIEVLLRRFDDAEDSATLVRQANSAGGENGLQSSWGFGFRQRHGGSLI